MAPFAITMRGETVAVSPTGNGIAAIANIYGACRRGCTFAGTASDAAIIRAMGHSSRRFAAIVKPYGRDW